MAPIKFEEHIKEKLDAREIKPSDASWNTISDRLSTSEKPRKKGYFWYGIAASFIGLLLISILYFNKKEQQDPKATEMVTSPASEGQPKESVIKKDILVPTEFQEEVVVQTGKKPSIKTKPKEENVVNASATEQSYKDLEKNAADLDKIAIHDNTLEKEVVKTPTEVAIEAKIAEVIAQVEQKDGTSEEMTDLEVDSLLRKAQRELLTNKLFRADNSVDAKALLAEAEGELDRSLRDQLFDALKTGYLKVRTAVADRNN